MTLKEQISAGVEELGAIPYFPKESGAQLAVMRAVEKFVSGPRELRWLIDTAVGRMREWRGVAELRGLYCTHFKPADGIEADCTIPGLTPADSEAGYLELQAAETARQIEGYRQQKLLAAPGEVFDAPELPPAKTIAPPVDRTTRDVAAFKATERLAEIVRAPIKPISIPGTPKRTDEENAQIVRDLEKRLAARQEAIHA